MKDLLEIAAYIYTADCATKRNGKWEDDESTEPWPRDLHFVIPVRDLAFWQREDVLDLLIRLASSPMTNAHSISVLPIQMGVNRDTANSGATRTGRCMILIG